MLILRRKSGESIVIGKDINVTVLDINEGSVRLAIDAPKVIPILRSELLQAADANRDSAVAEKSPSRDLLRFLGGNAGGHPVAAKQNHPRTVRPVAAEPVGVPSDGEPDAQAVQSSEKPDTQTPDSPA